MMEPAYRATNHNIIKALEQAKISFPISRQEFMERVDGISIQVDYNKVVYLTDHCKDITADWFDTKGHFFCLLNATKWGFERL